MHGCGLTVEQVQKIRGVAPSNQDCNGLYSFRYPTREHCIESGQIELNGQVVYNGERMSYDACAFGSMCTEKELTVSTVEVRIGAKEYDTRFACSSSEVLNSLIDDIARRVDEDQGLISFTIENLADKNCRLDAWPFSQLAKKCHSTELIKLNDLCDTSAQNRIQLLRFVTEVADYSQNL